LLFAEHPECMDFQTKEFPEACPLPLPQAMEYMLSELYTQELGSV